MAVVPTKFYAMPPRAIWLFVLWTLGAATLGIVVAAPPGWWTPVGVAMGGFATGGGLFCLLALMWRHYWRQWD